MNYQPNNYNPLPAILLALKDPKVIEYPHYMMSIVKVELAKAGIIPETDEETLVVYNLLNESIKPYIT